MEGEMDVLQTIVDLFASMGTGLVAALFVLVAMVLIWLLMRASRRGSGSKEPAVKRAQNNRYHQDAAEPQNQSPAPQPTAASPQLSPESPVVAKSHAPDLAAPDKHVEALTQEPEDSVLHRHY
jgi:hypothetical protein